MTKLFNST